MTPKSSGKLPVGSVMVRPPVRGGLRGVYTPGEANLPPPGHRLDQGRTCGILRALRYKEHTSTIIEMRKRSRRVSFFVPCAYLLTPSGSPRRLLLIVATAVR